MQFLILNPHLRGDRSPHTPLPLPGWWPNCGSGKQEGSLNLYELGKGLLTETADSDTDKRSDNVTEGCVKHKSLRRVCVCVCVCVFGSRNL